MKEEPSGLGRLVRWVTGARENEAARVILCFFALHFLLISYYLIKPLRNSQFLKEFDPDFLPVVSFGVVILSFIVTKLFSYLADRVEKYRLVTGTYLVIMVLKLQFAWLLMHAGKPVVVAFYFFASVYFLLAIATMWACANDIFTPGQGERCYGFIAVGSTLGGIVGSWLSGQLSDSAWRDYAPIASALCMGLALSLIQLAARQRRRERADVAEMHAVSADAAEGKFWSDFQEILRRPYVRRIGIMVTVLAMFNTSLDYISNRAIDRGISKEQFAQAFPYLHAEDYARVYSLKTNSPDKRKVVLESLAAASGVSPGRLNKDYEQYRQGCESQTRSLFSDVYLWQGIAGIFLLLVVARLIFSYLGVRFATVVLPVLAIVGVVAFAFPLALVAVESIMVIIGATNYSLNNAAKELLYTASDENTKFKYKPVIEGPGMRLGDVMAAVLALALEHAARYLEWSDSTREILFLLLLLAATVVWLRAAYLAGREYDKERSQSSLCGEL